MLEVAWPRLDLDVVRARLHKLSFQVGTKGNSTVEAGPDLEHLGRRTVLLVTVKHFEVNAT